MTMPPHDSPQTMLFVTADAVAQVCAGEKTLAIHDHTADYERPDEGVCRVGSRDPTAGERCWVRVTDVCQTTLGELTDAEATAAGFESLAEARDAWATHKDDWDPTQPVDVVTFEYVGDRGCNGEKEGPDK